MVICVTYLLSTSNVKINIYPPFANSYFTLELHSFNIHKLTHSPNHIPIGGNVSLSCISTHKHIFA